MPAVPSPARCCALALLATAPGPLAGCTKPPAPVPLAVAPPPLPPTLAPADPARGAHLVHAVAVCTACHGPALTGAVTIDGFPMGRISAPNLTLLDHYGPTDWLRALRHGASPEGRALLLMPADDYAALSATDLHDMIAYLDGLAPAGDPAPPLALGPVGRMLVKKGRWTHPGTALDHSQPPPAPAADRGAWLAQVAGCLGCHGGGPGQDFGPGQPPAPTLTPHPDGLASWSLADFERALRQGRGRDGRRLDPMMPWAAYAAWPDEDVAALWAHLATLPPQPSP